MIINLHFSVIASDSVSIHRCVWNEEAHMPKTELAPVIDLAAIREKLKCKRCDGVGLIAVEVPLKTIADSFGVEAVTCARCHGKGFCK